MPAAGVFKKEIDLSLYVEVSSDLKVAIVHTFSKGPINTRTLVTNNSQLESTFGKPIDDDVHGQGFFALREYFRSGNQAFVVRAESSANPAVTGKTGLQGGADDQLESGADGATSLPATRQFTSAGSTFQTNNVLPGDHLEIADTGGSADDGFYTIVSVDLETQVTVDRDFPTGSLSSLDFVIWTSQCEGTASDGATSAPATRQFTSATSFFSTNVQAGDILEINDVSSDGDNGFYVIESVDSDTQLTVNRDWFSGSLTGLDFTVYTRNHPDGTDGDTTTDGVFVSASSFFQSHSVQTGDLLVINDVTDTGDNGVFVIEGLTSGSEETSLDVNVGTWPTGGLTGLSFSVFPSPITLPGESEGAWVNGYQARTTANATDSEQFDLNVFDENGFLVETVFGLDTSNIVDEMAENSAFFPEPVVNTGRSGPGIIYTATANGGENGTTGIVDADLIGTGSNGLQSFSNVEDVEIDVLLIPGYSSQAVGDALINMAESTRGDCMAIVDPPDSPTVSSPQDVVDWHNGVGGFGRTSALSSSYGALYWSWAEIFDPFTNTDRFIAPSGHALSVWAQSQNATQIWFAPAGLRRGRVRGAQALRASPSQGERNLMQTGGNSVNPIVNFVREGIHVFGQKTLLRTNSALNRISVRRMLLFAEREILALAKTIVFEPGDEITDRDFTQKVTPLLEFIQDNRGIRESLVVAASTAADRDANRAVYQIFIKPTTTAEVVEVQFILTAQTADFSEILAA